MKRSLVIIVVIILLTIVGCERDDICIDETTPNLTIKFLDSEDDALTKSVTNLSAKVINGSEIDSLNILVSDTIASIPVQVTADFTQYVLTINSTNGTELIRDTLTLNYTREEVFVGRSCGFKTLFNDINISDLTNNWIQDIEIVTDTINNEEAVHINISH